MKTGGAYNLHKYSDDNCYKLNKKTDSKAHLCQRYLAYRAARNISLGVRSVILVRWIGINDGTSCSRSIL